MEMPVPDFLHAIIGEKQERQPGSLAFLLVSKLAGASRHGLALAAAFDFLVAAKLFKGVALDNWLWCEHAGKDFYPILNVCPACIYRGEFVHHRGNKPESGSIGPATASALRELLTEYFEMSGRDHLSVYSGREPVDLAIVDSRNLAAFVAEVKASPLYTPLLVMAHDHAIFRIVDRRPMRHNVGNLSRSSDLKMSMLIPSPRDYWLWELPPADLGEDGLPEACLKSSLELNDFERFVESWSELWALYLNRQKDSPQFWFTGACGTPRSPGEGWPTDARGRPKGSISDSKTSVGMDRTDDIKKSTFQVLNMGVRFRRGLSGSRWRLRIGLASNLHAGRHHGDYLTQYEDIVWGWHGEDGPTEWHNLFDAIISFSQSYTRDAWIQEVISWH